MDVTTTIPQYRGVLILIKGLGLTSMTASSFIIRHILKRLSKRETVNRPISQQSIVSKVTLTQSIMLCLSCADLISSFFVPVLSTWMVPKENDLVWASGNLHTCTAQGYISVMFFGLSVFSNASLAVSHCLVVRFGWSDREKQRKRIAFTLVPFTCALILSIIPLIWQSYNYNGGFYCDINAAPLGCDYKHSEIDCVRGANASKILLYVQLIPFMIAFVVIAVAVSLLIHAVHKQEKRMDRYTFRGAGTPREPSRALTTQTTYQGIWYIAAFGITWIPWYAYAFDEVTGGGVIHLFDYMHLFTKPLQGLLNSLVYFRPKYLSARARNPNEPRLESLRRVLELPTPRCCLYESSTTQQQEQPQHNDKMRPAEKVVTININETDKEPINDVIECGDALVKVSTLTTGTFEQDDVKLASLAAAPTTTNT